MKFEFTEQETNYILNVLAQRPYHEAVGIIQKIQGQARQLQNNNMIQSSEDED